MHKCPPAITWALANGSAESLWCKAFIPAVLAVVLPHV